MDTGIEQYVGDIEKGRPLLGPDAPVFLYRLLQYTMREILIADHGLEAANATFIGAGRLAGLAFANKFLQIDLAFNAFLADLQQVLKAYRLGILRVEQCTPDPLTMTVTVAEDLDCSGLPMTGDILCHYDEGFLAGILEAYTGDPMEVREIDCWANGDRVCRFTVHKAGE